MKKISLGLAPIVTRLNSDEYQDGTSIGKQLDITRSAVWKAIKKLTLYGVPIESVKSKGYRLKEPLILLDKKQLKQQLQNRSLPIDIFETITSTNDYLKNFRGDKKPRVCLAEQQTKGRGRLNRTWHSPFGKNIYCSFLFPLEKDLSELAGLSLVVGLAIVKTLQCYQLPVQVKWPNDIIYQQKKLAGTLIEVQAETHDICHAIIGIGMNVNMLTDDKEISQPWISLQKMTGTYIDRNPLCAQLIDNLISYLTQFAQHGLSYFLPEWNSVDNLFDQEVTLKCAQKKISGRVKGINAQGHLLLQLADGNVQAFSSGEAAILK